MFRTVGHRRNSIIRLLHGQSSMAFPADYPLIYKKSPCRSHRNGNGLFFAVVALFPSAFLSPGKTSRGCGPRCRAACSLISRLSFGMIFFIVSCKRVSCSITYTILRTERDKMWDAFFVPATRRGWHGGTADGSNRRFEAPRHCSASQTATTLGQSGKSVQRHRVFA